MVASNPLLVYKPHPKQQIFHRSRAQLKAFLGGNRSGKTTAGILDDLIQAVDEDCLPPHLAVYKRFSPPFYCRVIVPDFTSTLEGVVFQKLREWAPKAQLTGDRFDKAYDKTRRKLHFKNGSWFDFLTYEQDLDKFGGAALHRIHYDEQPPEDIRNEGLMRLIDFNGDECFTLTPMLGLQSWMFDKVWEPWTKHQLKHGFVVTVDMDENPHLPAEAKERLLEGLSQEEREARKEGRFVHFSGMIYPDFNSPGHDHIIPQAPIPDVPVYVGIDPGIRHMAAFVWCYLTPEDEMVVFDELALVGRNIAEACEAIKMKNAEHGRDTEKGRMPLIPRWYVIDPSARNVFHQTGRSDQSSYAEYGIVTVLGQNSLSDGINRVKARLQVDRLKVMANCTELIREFKRYRWAPPSRVENDPKEEPVKKDDHLLDALRYVVASRPLQADVDKEQSQRTELDQAREELWKTIRAPKPRTTMGGVFR
jgi:phage terminase large subunit-like protein